MELERHIFPQLDAWKDAPERRPLIVRGARQVGKTWLLKEFGRRRFSGVIYCNFDREAEMKEIFANKAPERIVGLLEMATGKRATAGKTLLILDEIQECPEALNALKYFCEEMPALHVAAAGSLLGILMAKPYSWPVGKVDLLDLHPLDFAEFLQATEPELHAVYRELPLDAPVLETLHRRLLDALHRYLIIGGMPECVAAWAARRDPAEARRRQKTLLALYEGDFGKHASSDLAAKCLLVFHSLPAQLAKENEKFVYGVVKKGARARDLEEAITWLVAAGIFVRVPNLVKLEIPLKAHASPDAFKLFLHDTGLMRQLAGVPNDAIILRQDYQFKGPLAENYVLQQLRGKLAMEPCYFADRSGREIDFVIQAESEIVPVEVKGGANVKAISLQNYVKKRRPALAVRFSERNLAREGNLLDLPLYFAPRLGEILPGGGTW